MGTGSFGVPTLEMLYETEHEIAALVTQPAARSPRGKELPPPEIVQCAMRHGTPIVRFEKIKSPEAVAYLKSLNADLFFICDYGQILSREGIQAARLGGLNLHGSLLPRYRGAAPVQWAVYNGDKTAGITVIYITPEIDAGPMVEKAALEVLPDETADQLERRLAKLGAPCVVRAIHELAANEDLRNHALPQDPLQASGAPKLKKTDAHIDWTRSATQIRNQIRALEPWPRTYTDWERVPGKPPVRLMILPVPTLLSTELPPGTPPGTVLSVGETLDVATGDGILSIRRVQPSGKKPMDIPSFANGYGIKKGSVLF